MRSFSTPFAFSATKNDIPEQQRPTAKMTTLPSIQLHVFVRYPGGPGERQNIKADRALILSSDDAGNIVPFRRGLLPRGACARRQFSSNRQGIWQAADDGAADFVAGVGPMSLWLGVIFC